MEFWVWISGITSDSMKWLRFRFKELEEHIKGFGKKYMMGFKINYNFLFFKPCMKNYF